MKKTLLAIAIPALFAASAVNAATVYEKDGVSADVYGRAQFDVADDGENTDGTGSARLGVRGKSAITDKISGLARGEWQVAAENSGKGDDKDGSFVARHVYAGFEHADYGQLVFGQTDTAFYQAVAATDIFNTYGYEAANIIESGRQEGQAVYSGTFGGFYVGASYQFRDPNYTYTVGGADGTADVATGTGLDNGYAATLGYNFDFGLSVYAGGNYEALMDGQDDKKNVAVSASYTLGDLYLGALYAQAKMGDVKLKGYDFVAAYSIDATKLYTGYANQDLSGAETRSNGNTADAFKLGASYNFTSNFMTWAEYLVDGIDGHDNQWDVAIQYNF